MKIATEAQRQRLAVRRDPYFEDMGGKLHLGIYRGEKGDKWVARIPHPTGKSRYLKHSLADATPTPGGLTFAEAASRAEQWQKEAIESARASAIKAEQVTVEQAVDHWYADLMKDRSDRSQTTTTKNWRSFADRVKRFFGPDTPLGDITKAQCHEFRDTPVRGDTRAKSSGDKELGLLKAAFNLAVTDLKHTGNSEWVAAEKHGNRKTQAERADTMSVDEMESGGRAMSMAEVRKLIKAAETFSPAYATYLRAAVYTLQRPQELRMLDTFDFSSNRRVIRYRYGKNRRHSGPKTCQLFDKAHALFADLTSGKQPNDPILTNDAGERWVEGFQVDPFYRALALTNIDPEGLRPYSIRHSAITWAIQTARIDPMTVAAIADTSVDIIVRHYFNPTKELGAGFPA